MKYSSNCHPCGETLPADQQVFRVKVVKTFLRGGVPMSKVNVFRELFEETGFRLTDTRYMLDLFPFILKEIETKIKQKIEGKHVSVILDGITRLGEALAIVLQFISPSWTIEQWLIWLQLLTKSLRGEEVARGLIRIFSTQYGVGPDQLIASTRDRASVNSVAMQTLEVIYPNILDVGCFSHTLDHAGGHFKTPNLSEFATAWLMLCAHSPKVKLLSERVNWTTYGHLQCSTVVEQVGGLASADGAFWGC